jgi:hypothetical protein
MHSFTERRIADFLGRRYAMSTECIVFIVGVIIQITSTNVWQQYAVGRLISGLGVGALSAAVPIVCTVPICTYLSSCVPSIKRKPLLHKSVVH